MWDFLCGSKFHHVYTFYYMYKLIVCVCVSNSYNLLLTINNSLLSIGQVVKSYCVCLNLKIMIMAINTKIRHKLRI